jgi:hypothetical protein
MPGDLAESVVIVFEEIANLGPLISKRRVHAQEIRRTPASCRLSSARRSGTDSQSTRGNCSAPPRRNARPESATTRWSTVTWWCRDISQTCLMLPVSASSRWWMRNASRSSGARRPVSGS